MSASVVQGPPPPRVVVLDDYEGAIGSSDELGALRDRVQLEAIRRPLDLEELEQALAGCRIVVAIRERTRLTEDVFARMPDVELVLQTGGHAYHVDLDAATRHGVAVSLGRGSTSPTPVVAELVFGLLITWFRRLTPAITGMSEGRWPSAVGRTLHGRTMGILGLGRHGMTVARLARAFGMPVLAWGPTLTDERAQSHGAERRELEDLLGAADVVSVHLRLSPESRGLIGARELALMRREAVLVNTSRGPIVEEAALLAALRDGTIAAALLDVFDEEPLPPDHPLRSLPNVLCTPHMGYTVDAAFEDFARTTARQLAAYLDGRLAPEHVLNRQALGAPRRRCGGIAGTSAGAR